MHVSEEKRRYQQIVLTVEMGSFTPLVFGTNGGVGTGCKNFLKHSAKNLGGKKSERYTLVTAWLRARITFEILRSGHR